VPACTRAPCLPTAHPARKGKRAAKSVIVALDNIVELHSPPSGSVEIVTSSIKKYDEEKNFVTLSQIGVSKRIYK
jgi:hypothetical protein